MGNQQPGIIGPDRREYQAKIILIAIFLSSVGLAAWISGPDRLVQTIQSWSVLDFVLLSLATFRLGRLVAYDRVMEPLRSPFTRTVPDSTGAGESVEPKGEGAVQAIGQMISCPICSGTWIAALLVYGLVWLPEITRLFLWMSAAIGVAELINSATEALCWAGQLNRTLAGKHLANPETGGRAQVKSEEKSDLD